MKKIMCGVVSVLFGLAFFCPLNVSASASVVKRENSQAALDFTLETVQGKSVSLAEYKNKGVILFFFTTWCPMCQRKIPALSKDYGDCQKDGVNFFAVDVGESLPKVSSFAAKHNVPFDILLDKDMKFSEQYDVMGVPTFIIIGKSGRVVYAGNDMAGNYKELLAQ